MIRRRRSRAFQLALAFSVLFHLSMVTLFRIVIYFPRNDINYLNVDIVRTDLVRERFRAQRLEVPSSDDAFERMAGRTDNGALEDPLASTGPTMESAESDPWSGLPEIQLPRLRFEELDRLRFQVQGLEVGKRYDDRFRDAGGDLWSRFGRQLGSVSDALTSVVRGSRPLEPGPHPIAVPQPAPGYEAYVEWLTPPYDREALGGAKIDALWGRDPRTLPDAIALPFRVDAEGGVIEVLPPLEGDPSVVDDAMFALRECRFESLGLDRAGAQMGTYVIRGAPN